MRLWSVHPRYLDRQGLTACWREALLAQAVLERTSGGYRNHPQLVRFRACADPVAALGAYLSGIADEADARGYRFARDKIVRGRDARNAEARDADARDEDARDEAGRGAGVLSGDAPLVEVTTGQLAYEWTHLLRKLEARSPERHAQLKDVVMPDPHPLFLVVDGGVASWERPA